MIKTRGSLTDLQLENGAVLAIVRSWNDSARQNFQMHSTPISKWRTGPVGQHFFQDRNRTIQLPLIAPHLKKTSAFSALFFLMHTIDKISSQFLLLFLVGQIFSLSIFSGSSNIKNWVFRDIDRRLSYWLHWANDAVLYVPFVRIPLSDLLFILLFQATYLRHVRGFLKSRLPDQTTMP